MLSTLTSHPDRYWIEHNWIDDSVRKPVRDTFRWSAEEAIRLACAADGEWERGTVGQDVTLLLAEDPNVRHVLKAAVDKTYADRLNESWILFCLYLYFFREDALEVMMEKLPTYPEFRRHPAFDAVREHIEENGYLARHSTTRLFGLECRSPTVGSSGCMVKKRPDSYPHAADPTRVGDYPASAFAGGGFVWDDVLEYRVWCHPENGAEDADDGNDYYYAFATYEEALKCSETTAGADEPLALILQKEYIDEPSDGHYVHVKESRVTEWPVEFLRRPRRTDDTIPQFFAPDAPANRLDILRGKATAPTKRR